jgi:uncharacterized protein (DUF2267 family)
MSKIQELERAFEETQGWINDLTQRLGWRDRERVVIAFVAGLHGLRDCLPFDEAIFLGTHLPTLLRGLYFEGWHPAREPETRGTRDALLERIHDSVHRDPGIDAEEVARAILALLADRLPADELEDVKAVTPEPLRALWPD